MKSLSRVQLCSPMDCSPPGSSIHGILQARVLEWVAISFSRGSSWPRDWTWVSSIAGRCFYHLSHQGSPKRRLRAKELTLSNCAVEDLIVPWTAKKSKQSILRETNPEHSLEGLMLKLKLQYFGLLMWRTDSLEKTFMLGKIEGRRRTGWQRMRWLVSITNSMDMHLSHL